MPKSQTVQVGLGLHYQCRHHTRTAQALPQAHLQLMLCYMQLVGHCILCPSPPPLLGRLDPHRLTQLRLQQHTPQSYITHVSSTAILKQQVKHLCCRSLHLHGHKLLGNAQPQWLQMRCGSATELSCLRCTSLLHCPSLARLKEHAGMLCRCLFPPAP
jgi:hypothetical protein